MIYEPTPQDNKFGVLWANPDATRVIVSDLLSGKHIDQTLAETAESFLFLEKYQSDWAEFFDHIGYRLQHGESGAMPFYYLSLDTSGKKNNMLQSNLSRSSTFIGFYLVLHFMELPPDKDTIMAKELWEGLIDAYSFPKLRAVFFRQSKLQDQVTETQTEKIKRRIAKALEDLWRFRFIEVNPGPRSPFETLKIKALPALSRFFEIAAQSLQNGEEESDLDMLMSAYLGAEPDDDTEDQGDESDE